MKIAVPGVGILLNKLLVRETNTARAIAIAPGYSPLLYGEILLLNKHTFWLQDIKISILQ